MNDQLFVLLSIVLMVELLSQMFKLEMFGKVFVQFYVVILHLIIAATLLTYESKDLVFYFVTLVSLINTLRFALYKIPTFRDESFMRFLLDLSVIGGFVYLIYRASPMLSFNVSLGQISEYEMYAILGSFAVVLVFEMIQRLNGLGLDINNFFPDTFMSFLIVLVSIVYFVGILLNIFIFHYYMEYVYYTVPIFAVLSILFLLLSSLNRYASKERLSLLYVMPSILTIVVFISVLN